MEIQAGLLIDFGNSETRVIVTTSKRSYQFNLSNRFAELPLDYRPNKKYVNKDSLVFALPAQAPDGTPYYRRFASGKLAEVEFGGYLMSPSPNKGKTEQLTTHLTLNLAIIHAIVCLSNAEAVPVPQLDVKFDVSVLLPPRDHKAKEELMRKIVHDCTVVRPMLPYSFERTFTINSVNVYSESVAAFFGAMFKEVGARHIPENDNLSLVDGDIILLDNNPNMTVEIVDENQVFQDGYVLVIDIGAGTSDVALFKDIELIEHSRETFPKGGKLVEAEVIQLINAKYGYEPEFNPSIIAEAQFKEGIDLVDVSELVEEAKKRYSEQMRAWLDGYINRMQVNMRDIGGVLIVGGGALPSIRQVDDEEVVVASAMSDILVAYLKELAPRIRLLNLDGKNLRYLNIDGLKILHNYANK